MSNEYNTPILTIVKRYIKSLNIQINYIEIKPRFNSNLLNRGLDLNSYDGISVRLLLCFLTIAAVKLEIAPNIIKPIIIHIVAFISI